MSKNTILAIFGEKKCLILEAVHAQREIFGISEAVCSGIKQINVAVSLTLVTRIGQSYNLKR